MSIFARLSFEKSLHYDSDWASFFVSDFVTPLKKRRMARESVDGPQSAGPSTSSPLLAPTVSQFGELEGQPTEVAQEESKPFFPNYTPSVKVIAVCLIY